MTAAALTPRVRIMAICDSVRASKTEADVFDLKGVRQGINASAFPSEPMPLWLFLVLSSPRAGEFPCYIRVIHDRTDRTIFYSYSRPRPSFGADGDLCMGRARLRCTFPEEGRYTVQVWFFQEQGLDVLKGEMPFYVSSERN